jgi:hypothetical protein
MKSELILEKLATLDPANKDHWNQDGQPRLGAVGEGIKREDIIAVAPLFSRSNPVLPAPVQAEPEPEVTEEEIKAEVEKIHDKFDAHRAKLQQANDRVKAALAAKSSAEEELEAARLNLQVVTVEGEKLDTRTDTQINQDYLASELKQRLERAGRTVKIEELLSKERLLGTNIRIDSLSPLDRAIAEANIRARRSAGRK